jgi:chemotaxis regulatin CheY-phosphate phosphatase CheZ
MSGTDKLQQRVQREINDLSEVITALIENFKQVKSPLQESREKVPQATDQLDRVTEQTEAATHQMLDRLERITDREESVIGGLEEISRLAESGQLKDVTDIARDLHGQATDNLNDAFLIMDALQFQDITTQQINHAAALLEDIDRKLRKIIVSLDEGMDGDLADDKGSEDSSRVYDGTARYTDRQAEQKDIDSLFEEAHRKQRRR